MRRKTAYAVVTCFWLVAIALLVRQEIAPVLALRAERKATFADYAARLRLPYEEKMGIYFLNERIGKLVTTIKRQPGDWLSVKSKAVVSGQTPAASLLSFQILSEMLFDEKYELSSVDMQLHAMGMSVEIKGLVQHSVLNLRINANGETTQKSVPIDPQIPVADSFFPFAGAPDLEVGSEWRTTVINPMSLELDSAKVTIVEERVEEVEGKREKVYVLKTEYAGQETESWVTGSGVLLKQESPLGIRLVREQ